MTASVRPHRSSGHEADSLLSNNPDYCHDKPYDDEQLGVYHNENCLITRISITSSDFVDLFYTPVEYRL